MLTSKRVEKEKGQIVQEKTKTFMKVGDTKNLIRIMARPLEYLFGLKTLSVIMRMKKLNPIEPFNPLLHPTMISDNHDNETRPQCTTTKAVFKEEEQIASIGAFNTPLVGILLAATDHLLLVGVYIGREIDEKMMKVLNITKRLTKAPQEYQKFITDIRSSQEKFTLKMPSIRVTVVNQVVFLSLSNQAKSEEERKMLLEMYFEEVDDSDDNPQ